LADRQTLMANVQQLWRPSVTLVALFVVGYLGIVGYARAMRAEADDSHKGAVATAAPTPRAESPAASPSDLSMLPDLESQSSPRPPADAIAKWVTDAVGDDAKARAIAIAALAKAPRAQALPPLKRVLESGDSAVDRPLALSSLRTLAFEQGDADNQIRETLREAVYHVDDEQVARDAQTTLDEVEQAVSGTAASVR
jgi:hypothetical protein